MYTKKKKQKTYEVQRIPYGALVVIAFACNLNVIITTLANRQVVTRVHYACGNDKTPERACPGLMSRRPAQMRLPRNTTTVANYPVRDFMMVVRIVDFDTL